MTGIDDTLSFGLNYQRFGQDTARVIGHIDRIERRVDQVSAKMSRLGFGTGFSPGSVLPTGPLGPTPIPGRPSVGPGVAPRPSPVSPVAPAGVGAGLGLGLGGFAGIVGGFAAISAARDAVDTMVDFERIVAKIGGVTGKTGNELDRYAKLAREAGEATIFSATESAEALLQLTRRGRSIEEQESALVPLLNFSTAADISLPQGVQIASDIATQFREPFSEIQKVTDLVNASANRAGTNVVEMGRAFQDSGAILSKFGVEIEEVAALIQVLADAGIRGQRAGIAIRNIATTQSDALLNQGLTGFLESTSGRPIEELQELVNVRALPALASLSDSFEKFGEKVEENRTKVAGSTEQTAKALDETVGNASKRLGSAFDELSIATGELFGIPDSLRRAYDSLAGDVRSVSAAMRRETEERDRIREALKEQVEAGSLTKEQAKAAETLARGGGIIGGAASTTLGVPDLSVGGLPSNGLNGSAAPFGLSRPRVDAGAVLEDQAKSILAPFQAFVDGMPFAEMEEFIARQPEITGPGVGFQTPPDLSASLGEKEFTEDYKFVVRQLEIEAKALTMTRAEREAYIASIDATRDAYDGILPSIQEQIVRLERLRNQETALFGLEQSFVGLGRQAILAADDFEIGAERIIKSYAALIAETFALQPAAEILTGTIRDIGISLGIALGSGATSRHGSGGGSVLGRPDTGFTSVGGDGY